MRQPWVKICGMKYNTEAVASLNPQMLGFIFYDKSPRYFQGPMPKIPDAIAKVGVFVNAAEDEIVEKVQRYELDILQLHGDEDPKCILNLRKQLPYIKIWKVFHIDDEFHFDQLLPFESLVDAFLFDTKGKTLGGTGKRFQWSTLKTYPYSKPMVLSGGIGPEHLTEIKELIYKDNLPIETIDLNSRFELKPGQKNIELLKKFMNELSCR